MTSDHKLESHSHIRVSVLENWVEQLLIHKERDGLYDGFVAFLTDILQPEKIHFFTNKDRRLVAHRQQNLADILVFDSRCDQKELIALSKLPSVLKTVTEKSPWFDIDEKNQQQTLYIPFFSGENIKGVLVLRNIKLSDEARLVWPSSYKSYQYLNNTLYLAEIDPLTGLMNRLKFEKLVTKSLLELDSLAEDNTTNFLALIDIDFFKRINDSFGHLYGDEVLVLLARYMTQSFRSMDWLFRYGGEEFIVILRNLTVEDAEQALERFREMIEQKAFPQMERKQVTVSIGYTQMRRFDVVSSLIDRADHALYYVKNNGRNKVASYEVLVNQGLLVSQQQQAEIELF